MDHDTIGIVVEATGSTGVLHQLTGVIARHQGDISSVEMLDSQPEETRTYFEVVLPGSAGELLDDLRALPIVRGVEMVKTLRAIYGKRIIIMGGGAQVGQVAIGAVSEADRRQYPWRTLSPWTPFHWSASGNWPTPYGRWRGCRVPRRWSWLAAL